MWFWLKHVTERSTNFVSSQITAHTHTVVILGDGHTGVCENRGNDVAQMWPRIVTLIAHSQSKFNTGSILERNPWKFSSTPNVFIFGKSHHFRWSSDWHSRKKLVPQKCANFLQLYLSFSLAEKMIDCTRQHFWIKQTQKKRNQVKTKHVTLITHTQALTKCAKNKQNMPENRPFFVTRPNFTYLRSLNTNIHK